LAKVVCMTGSILVVGGGDAEMKGLER